MPYKDSSGETDTPAGYGSTWFKLWYHGLRDRLRGEHARANARWGHVRAPEGTGRIIWFKAGASERSVRLGAELLGALRQRRFDVRLVLTFEHEFPRQLDPRLAGMKKVGVGYGPCDAPRAVRRMLKRFSPLLGIVCIEEAPPPNLLSAASHDGVHVVAYNAGAVAECKVEACYPVDETMAEAERAAGRCGYIAPAVDPLAQLVEAQIEPSFRSLIGGSDELTLAWMHFPNAAAAADAVREWREDPLAAESLLCISVEAGARDLPGALAAIGESALRLSRWSREAVEPATLIWADERRWYPALSVSTDLIHLAAAPRELYWQALAGGVPVSFAPGVLPETLRGSTAEGEEALAEDANITACLARWRAYRSRPPEARRLGDACRRRLWAERRRSAEVVEELIQRMYGW